MINITGQILTQNVQTFEQNANILTSHCTDCVVTNIYLYYSYYFTSVLIICFFRTHFIPVNFLRHNLKVWYRLMVLMVHLHTLLHTCSAHRCKISTPKFNVRNSSSILVTASSRKQKKSFVEMLYFFIKLHYFRMSLTGISHKQPVSLCFAAGRHNCKLQVDYKNYKIIQAFMHITYSNFYKYGP